MWQQVRTGEADIVARRVQGWLDGELSQNLRASLGCFPGTERHAVLVFDSLTEPEVATAESRRMAFRPRYKLSLPVEVDVVWMIMGPVACRYNDQDGWQTVLVADGPLAEAR